MTKTIAVIDGNSLMHRAFHAVPPTMTTPAGTPSNAAFGFMSMLLKFIEQAQPDALVCAFDKGHCTFRIEMLEQYKAQRPHMDDDLRVQFPLIESLLAAMNVPVVSVEGWEGDDILGTVSAMAEKLGYASLLVTGDKDAYQLASESTRIVTTKRGITDVVIYGPDEVKERYGVTPSQFTDFLGLKGDSSDNIPGVAGVGDKRAASMLQRFGNLEGIYENLDAFKGKQLENLIEHKEDAFVSRQVATILRTAPIELDLEHLVFPSFDEQTVTEAFGVVGFRAHLSKVLALQQHSQQAIPTLVGWEEPLQGTEALEALQAYLKEMQNGSELPGVAISWGTSAQASLFDAELFIGVRFSNTVAVLSGEQATCCLVECIRHARVITHDAKGLLECAYPSNTAESALLSAEEVLEASVFDIALAAYVLDSNNGLASLSALLQTYTSYTTPEELDDIHQYSFDACAAQALEAVLLSRLDEQGVCDVFDTIDTPLIGVLAMMERTGAAIDTNHLATLAQSTAAEVQRLREAIYAAAGSEFNIDSPKQLSKVLFDDLGLPPRKKTQRGYSTNAQVLQELASEHEVPGLVLEYREYAKIKSTYIDALPRMQKSDGRVHTSFNQMVTTTGRLSSSDPNLQNIPVRSDFGRSIRECFVPLGEGEVFLAADYSQIELRLLAHLSGDEHLIDAFAHGADFHTRTASRVFGVPEAEITPQLRSRAKAVNFGIVYGQQAYGLSQSLHIGYGEAKDIIDRYFEAYPQVRCYLDDVVNQATRDGYAQTLFGRRRYIPELTASNATRRGFGQRTAMNHPMQGSAADIIKLAMRKVAEELLRRNLNTRLLLQVHDELDFSVPEAEVEEVSPLVTAIMESVVTLSVPLKVDVAYGVNWAQAH